MKRIIIIFSLSIVSLSAVGQKDTTAHRPIIDTTNKVNDSTGLITIADFNELYEYLQELPAKYANPIISWFSKRFTERINQYYIKKKKAK